PRSGTATARLLQKTSSTPPLSNALSGLRIQNLPLAASSPGTATLGYLNAAVARARQFQTDIIGTRLDTQRMRAALTNEIASLDNLATSVTNVVQNPNAS